MNKPYTLWDHEEAGGFGYFRTREEAIAAAGRIMTVDAAFFGPIPHMFLVHTHPSTVLGSYQHVECKIILEVK